RQATIHGSVPPSSSFSPVPLHVPALHRKQFLTGDRPLHFLSVFPLPFLRSTHVALVPDADLSLAVHNLQSDLLLPRFLVLLRVVLSFPVALAICYALYAFVQVNGNAHLRRAPHVKLPVSFHIPSAHFYRSVHFAQSLTLNELFHFLMRPLLDAHCSVPVQTN